MKLEQFSLSIIIQKLKIIELLIFVTTYFLFTINGAPLAECLPTGGDIPDEISEEINRAEIVTIDRNLLNLTCYTSIGIAGSVVGRYLGEHPKYKQLYVLGGAATGLLWWGGLNINDYMVTQYASDAVPLNQNNIIINGNIIIEQNNSFHTNVTRNSILLDRNEILEIYEQQESDSIGALDHVNIDQEIINNMIENDRIVSDINESNRHKTYYIKRSPTK